MEVLFIYLAAINTLTFLTFGVDKNRAKKDKWRIPESKLLFLSFIGGSLGGIIAMKLFRHKTKKPKFYIGVPIMFVANVMMIVYIVGYLK